MAKSKFINSADNQSISYIVQNSGWIGVPIYQRAYVWGNSEVGDFIDDIIHVAERNTIEHFFGSVVLAEEKSDAHGTDYWIIDGQQRLTTFFLASKALMDCGSILESAATGTTKESLFSLRNRLRAPLYSHDLQRVRLAHSRRDKNRFENILLSNVGNADAEAVLLKQQSLDAQTSLIDAAYLLLMKETAAHLLDRRGIVDDSIDNVAGLQEFAQANPKIAVDRYEAIVEAMNERCFAVKIEVSSPGAGFAIFEALNDRGKPLSPADLVKNHLLMKMASELSSESMPALQREAKIAEAEQLWEKILGNVKEARFARFLRTYLLLEKDAPDEVPLSKTFEYFRKLYADTKAEEVISRLHTASKAYGLIYRPSQLGAADKSVAVALGNLQELDAERSNPILLAGIRAGLHKKPTQDSFVSMLWALEVLYFRRSLILNKDNKALEKKFIECGRTLMLGKPDAIAEVTAEVSKLIPPNQEVKPALELRRGIRNKQATWLLRTLENSLLIDEQSPYEVKTVTLEHIMPQTRGDWPEVPDYEILVTRLGNLTLLVKGKNSSLGNQLWDVKRKKIFADKLHINSSLIALNEWTPEGIAERQQLLAELALAHWTVS